MFIQAVALGAALVTALSGQAQRDSFAIEIIRGQPVSGLIIGDLGVNGTNLGRSFENAAKRIPAGTYKGYIRYISGKNFVQGPLNSIATVGDFLLEVADVKEPDGRARTNILFHGGSKPSESAGCIMLGPVPKRDGVPIVPADHPLAKLRMLFYGTDTPTASPDKTIMITIVER